MGYILKEDVIRRCEAVKAIAEKQIKEWSEHTLEYKEKVSCQDAFDREREMRDILMYLEDLPDEYVQPIIYTTFNDYSETDHRKVCANCGYTTNPWVGAVYNYCPMCGAIVNKQSLT